MADETSSRRRPWAAVAPWPQDDDGDKARAHYAAMAYAYDRAMAEDGASPEALRRFTRPAMAAFAAAALIATTAEDGWDLVEISDALASGRLTEFSHQWLSDAGIDPATIAAADSSGDVERARSIAARLEQDAAESRRLLTNLVTEASNLDAWPSSGRTRALDEAKAHLARTGAGS